MTIIYKYHYLLSSSALGRACFSAQYMLAKRRNVVHISFVVPRSMAMWSCHRLMTVTKKGIFQGGRCCRIWVVKRCCLVCDFCRSHGNLLSVIDDLVPSSKFSFDNSSFEPLLGSHVQMVFPNIFIVAHHVETFASTLCAGPTRGATHGVSARARERPALDVRSVMYLIEFCRYFHFLS